MKVQSFLISVFAFVLFSSISSAQWEPVGDDVVPVDHRVWSIKIAPDNSIWAIATFGGFPPTSYTPKVFRSVDNGDTWVMTEIPQGLSNVGWDISPVDGNVAYAALDVAGLHKTEDGGISWTQDPSYDHRALFVHFYNENEGCVIGREAPVPNTVISVTRDGGQSWTEIGGGSWSQPAGTSLPTMNGAEYPGFTFSINSNYDYSESAFIFGMNNGNYWISKDKGFNWTRGITPLTTMGIRASNVTIKDETTFMVAGDTDSNLDAVPTVSFTTKDGGDTWIEGSPGVTCAGTQYIPNTNGTFIMVSHNDFGSGSVGSSISYDYGETWEVFDTKSLLNIDFINESTGYGPSWSNEGFQRWNFDLPSSTVDIDNPMSASLMPNPASDLVSIKLSNEFATELLVMEIISEQGQVLSSSTTLWNEEILIPTVGLPAGLYFLRVSNNQKSIVRKFVKQ